MKKKLVLALAVLSALQASGCASVQKKFTRKKKEPKHVAAAMFVEEGPYQKKFSNDYYYRTHYTMWRTWLDELVSQFGANRKKTERCAQEAYSNLQQLGQYLDDQKRAEFEPLVKDMGRIVQRIEAGNYSDSEEPGMRIELEKIGRLVANDFYYNKVKANILPDRVDLGAAEPSGS